MGYTHYWRVRDGLDEEAFALLAADVKRLLPALERAGVPLAGGLGEGDPEITPDRIWFNGPRDCGHEGGDIGIPWPSDTAKGVGKLKVDGTWAAGATLATRACDGDCSYETFHLVRKRDPERDPKIGPDRDGRFFGFTKTAYRPYDLAVTAALVVAKHHLGDDITVDSDGEGRDWVEAVLLVENELGYGRDFILEEES